MRQHQPAGLTKTIKRAGSIPLALTVVVLCSLAVSAASYVRTTLQELTTRAVAVADVEVLSKNYPPLAQGETFPRTYVELQTLNNLKGVMPERFILDIPGGINGNVVSSVPDGPDFKLGQRAIVFVKEPAKGHFMVQDLGLGKFDVVLRNGKNFVESPLCPRAMLPGLAKDQKDLEANLLTRSIPYATFCDLVGAYASASAPGKDAAVLAAVLPPSSAHNDAQVPSVLAEARELQRGAQIRRTWLWFSLVLGLVALAAALWVRRRRQTKAIPISARTVMFFLSGSLLAGASLGGSAAHAFVQFTQKSTWNLDTPLAGQVANTRVIWRQSTAVSKTNSNVFTNVQQSFDKWNSVSGSRLAFTAGGSTTVVINDSQDHQNTVAWTTTPSNDFSTSTLAITFTSFTQSTPSTFVDADIIFNDRDFNWASGGTGNTSSVSLHEIGHFVGLNHTTDNTTVMFPFDGGLTSLSPDEVSAAQTLYSDGSSPSTPPPSTASNSPPSTAPATPPNAAADASPKLGPVGTSVQFVSNSTPGADGSPLASFSWDFGDGSTGINTNGNPISHTYTAPGDYSAALTVTSNAGQTASATVVIEIGFPAQVSKSGFKLNFKSTNKDSFTATLSGSSLIGFKKPKGTPVEGAFVNIGNTSFVIQYDPVKGKNTDKSHLKLSVNDKLGAVTLKLSSDNIRDDLATFGAVNDNITGKSITVPVSIWFGTGSANYVFSIGQFTYTATAGKQGTGK